MRPYRGKRIKAEPFSQAMWCKQRSDMDKGPGEFVYGSLVKIADRCFIIPICDTCHSSEGYTGGTLYFTYWYQVDPATVGQSTGLKDKNGVEAYFADRLKDSKGIEYEIVWADAFAAFWVVDCEYPYDHFTAEIIKKLEIIHDTPPAAKRLKGG